MNYRIGYIHYQQENYRQAIEAMSHAYAEKAHDKNLLYGFGNAFFKRGDYFAALAAYEELLGLLNAQRARKEQALSNTRPDDVAFIERYMHTANNLGATLSRLSERTGDSEERTCACTVCGIYPCVGCFNQKSSDDDPCKIGRLGLFEYPKYAEYKEFVSIRDLYRYTDDTRKRESAGTKEDK